MSADSLPLITVFIPWIGREPYIQHAVESVLKQDYPNLEILISDNSLAHPPKLACVNTDDPRIRIVQRTERRLTAAEHYCACLQDARGDYVMILSDDDLIEPGYVSSMYAAIASHPGVTVCIGEQIAIGEYDDVVPLNFNQHEVRVYDGAKFLISRLLNPRALPIITYMSLFARRMDMIRYPYRNYPDGSNSDNYMMLALSLGGQVALCSGKLYYRIYERSAGLSTPFVSLLNACAQYKRDAAGLIWSRRRTIGLQKAICLRILIHIRSSTLISRRLFSLYRKRQNTSEFIASLAILLSYMCGLYASFQQKR